MQAAIRGLLANPSPSRAMSLLLQRCSCPRQLPAPAALFPRGRRGACKLQCSAFSSASQIAQIQAEIASGASSATHVVQQYLAAAEAQEPTLQSFITLDREGALDQVSLRHRFTLPNTFKTACQSCSIRRSCSHAASAHLI